MTVRVCVCVSVSPAEWNHPLSWAHSVNLALTAPYSTLTASFHIFFPVCLAPHLSSLHFLTNPLPFLLSFKKKSLSSKLLLFHPWQKIQMSLLRKKKSNKIEIMVYVQSARGANQGPSWEKHRGMGALVMVELENQAHCPREIKVPEKAALSTDGDKSSSSRHSGPEFNSPQPFLKKRLISCSIACCATSQAGMHRVVSLTPAHWVKKELGVKKREWEKVSAWIVTSILPEDVRWEADWGADRSWQKERGQESGIDWLLLGDRGQWRRIEPCSVSFLQRCEQHGKLLPHWTTDSGRNHLGAPCTQSWWNLTNSLPTSLSTISFVRYCYSSISPAPVQGASPVAKTHFFTNLDTLTPPPNRFNSDPPGLKKRDRHRQRERMVDK